MNNRIFITRQSSDQIHHAHWEFWFQLESMTLWLDSYTELERKTRRHVARPIRAYSRLEQRYSTIPVDEVPLPDDVTQEAHDKLMKMMQTVTVKKWKN
jgi:hypothetical protein